MPSVFTLIINGDLPGHFVWSDDRWGDRDMLFRRSLDAGVTWEPGEIHVYPYFHQLNGRARSALDRTARFVDRVTGTRRS